MNKLIALLASTYSLVSADAPVNCPVSSSWGSWEFRLGERSTDQKSLLRGIVDENGDYTQLGQESAEAYHFSFELYNQVTDLDTGATGVITSMYNQGFQFSIYGQKWFVYYYFKTNEETGRIEYSCEKTSVGWAVDDGLREYVRIYGHKLQTEVVLQVADDLPVHSEQKFVEDQVFINKINQNNKINEHVLWTAEHNKDNEKYTIAEMIKRSGSPIKTAPKTTRNMEKLVEKAKSVNSKIHSELKTVAKSVPMNLDWRNHNGENFVGTVDDQQSCGSCYSFAAMGLLESRVRIQTGNTQQPKFSEQEIITCGQEMTYNQGCEGGFHITTAGKYATEIGVVEESCVSYDNVDYDTAECADTSACDRWYASSYGYLGGFFGATSDDGGKAMMLALQEGPVAVSFNVVGDFSSYKTGVYTETGIMSEWNPIVPVNHGVLCVGYGVCEGEGDALCGDFTPPGTPYWIGKNSWGTGFGVEGYFLILRGVDECGWESMPFEAKMVPKL